MSYSCFISFKKMEESEIIPFLRSYKKETISNLKEIAKENCGYVPYIRDASKLPNDFASVPKEKIQIAKYWAKCCVFQHKYFYDKELKLLGMFSVPNCMRHMFDATIHFQNSCDQDYEKSTWQGIEAFEKIYDKWSLKSSDDIIKKYNEEYCGDFLKEYATHDDEAEEKFNYYRRDFAYAEIWEKFETYLYDEEEAIFFSIFGNYNLKEIALFVKTCHEEYIEDWKRFEKECGFKTSKIVE